MDNYGISIGQPMQARPPYIRFDKRAAAKQKPAAEGGGLYYVDQDWALVTPHGSKDTTEKLISDWFPALKEEARQGRFPYEWLQAYEAAYNAWKNDQPMPINGTPIKNWPAASPAEAKTLIGFGVLAVEDLAQANEELVARIGMGGRALKQRAVDWVTSNKDHAPLVAACEALRQANAGLQNVITNLKLENERLQEELRIAKSTQPMQQFPSVMQRQGSEAPDGNALNSKLIDKSIEEEIG